MLRPHDGALGLGFLAVLGEAIANLLQPWPLKIVLDEVFKNHAGRADPPHFVYRFVGADKFATIEFAWRGTSEQPWLNNIYFFVLGNSGKLMTHDFGATRERVKGFDTDQSFMLVKSLETNCISRQFHAAAKQLIPASCHGFTRRTFFNFLES